jgi:cell division protein FtsB
MYAVLKQRAYVWMKDYQTMDLQTSALHTLASGYRALSDRLREENQALKTEVKQLHQQLAQLAP